MRLINTSTMQFEEFWNLDSTPPYAILSHTWGNPLEEATFQDMKLHNWSNLEEKQYGYDKIRMTCQLARTKGLEYAWIDTCCIDKTSSAELSESINSMFKWYHRAVVCFAYLADWEPEQATFSHCKWFTRGWTLQELIASKEIDFYDKTWQIRGNKTTLRTKIYRTCHVPKNVLAGEVQLSDIPIANRMSWAASRTTSREEDIAYCLLGIFDINMPMLYGEGKKAFLRLQEKLIEECHDLSIFAWKKFPDDDRDFMGVLAPSPREFRDASRLRQTKFLRSVSDMIDFSLTNRGIHFQGKLEKERGKYSFLPIFHAEGSPGRRGSQNQLNATTIGVYLQAVGHNEYVRAFPDSFINSNGILKPREKLRPFRLVKSISTQSSDAIRTRRLHIRTPTDLKAPNFGLARVYPSECWQSSDQTVVTMNNNVFAASLDFNPEWALDYAQFTLLCLYRNLRATTLSAGIWTCQLLRTEAKDQVDMTDVEKYWIRAQNETTVPDFMAPSVTTTLELQHSKGGSTKKRVTATAQIVYREGRNGFPFVDLAVEDVYSRRDPVRLA